MILATPVTAEHLAGAPWGRAHWVAIADVRDGRLLDWQVHEVAWDEQHDSGTHGSHHARIVRFLREQAVEAVVVDHIGEGMIRTLTAMGLPIVPALPGDARASVLAAAAALRG